MEIKDEFIVISVLMENRSCCSDLHCEHGLSFHIQSPNGSVLFDTGHSGSFVKNAKKMGVLLSELDAVVLSHGHYDHTDGLPMLEPTAPGLKVYAHSKSNVERYSIKDPLSPRYVGMSEASKQAMNALEVMDVTAPIQICEGITCTGPVPRCNDFEDTGGPFFLDRSAQNEDPIVDDQAVLIDCKEGVILLLGCAHSGVVNTIRYCQSLRPNSKIHAIVGGFHLLNASSPRLLETYAVLSSLLPDLKVLAPCHCTGDIPMGEIESRFPKQFTDCRAGNQLRFSV